MQTERPWNVFAVGLDDFNLRLLNRVRHADRYRFLPLLDYESVVTAKHFDVNALLERARGELNAFDEPIDAIVGYWDFPAMAMMAVLRKDYGLRGPSLESVLRCDHKYWSRTVQREVIPDHIPKFAVVDPSDRECEGYPKTPLPYPFWLKPFKAHSSLLGFRVCDREHFEFAIDKDRSGLGRFAEPFGVLLSYADLPKEIADLGSWGCIAEEIISAGRQCTLEGYVFEGKVVIYGIIDSIRGPNRSSFHCYEYPSNLDESVKDRMR